MEWQQSAEMRSDQDQLAEMAPKIQHPQNRSDEARAQDQATEPSVPPIVDERTKELWKITDEKLAGALKAEQGEILENTGNCYCVCRIVSASSGEVVLETTLPRQH